MPEGQIMHVPEKECPKCHGHQWYCALEKIEGTTRKGGKTFKLKKIPLKCVICEAGVSALKSGPQGLDFDRYLGDTQ